jgi:hypothetical protein
MFFALELILGGTKCIGSNFHVLRSRNRFTRYRGHQIFFLILRSMTYFQRYRGRRVPFLCFSLPYSFSSVPWAPSPVFIFYALRLVFYGT